MKGKRSKQYRKLMQQYGLHFGFREPYQVLVDAPVLEDAFRFRMDFANMLEKTLHGKVKIMITQCSMRHLYNASPKNAALIEHAKGFERRRCGHHELEEPLTTMDCFKDVIDPKGSKTNKNHYVVATQGVPVRFWLRSIPGVPLIYLKRSVMIMEPMAGATEAVREQEERSKFTLGLSGQRLTGSKRKRDDDEDDGDDVEDDDTREQGFGDDFIKLPGLDENFNSSNRALSGPLTGPKRGKKKTGGPNPLSVQKKKKKAPNPPQLGKHSVSHQSSTQKPRKRRHKKGDANHNT